MSHIPHPSLVCLSVCVCVFSIVCFSFVLDGCCFSLFHSLQLVGMGPHTHRTHASNYDTLDRNYMAMAVPDKVHGLILYISSSRTQIEMLLFFPLHSLCASLSLLLFSSLVAESTHYRVYFGTFFTTICIYVE